MKCLKNKNSRSLCSSHLSMSLSASTRKAATTSYRIAKTAGWAKKTPSTNKTNRRLSISHQIKFWKSPVKSKTYKAWRMGSLLQVNFQKLGNEFLTLAAKRRLILWLVLGTKRRFSKAMPNDWNNKKNALYRLNASRTNREKTTLTYIKFTFRLLT